MPVNISPFWVILDPIVAARVSSSGAVVEKAYRLSVLGPYLLLHLNADGVHAPIGTTDVSRKNR
jgi:hypothetical protein